MKAVAVNALGTAPALMEMARPIPEAGQVLVKIQASGINPLDWRVGDGILRGKIPHLFPLILGVDGAGMVEAVGADVRRFKVGDQVVGQFLFGRAGEGSFADYAVIDQNAVLSLYPQTLPATSAAALPTAGITALQLSQRLDLTPGSTVLIVGATGGVGSFLTQLAARQGLQVIATASGQGAEQMRALGAVDILDYHATAIDKWVLAHYPGGIDGLVDLVSDAAGFVRNASVVKPGGIALSTIGSARAHELMTHGIQGGNFEVKTTVSDLDALVRMAASGELSVPVERHITLAQVPAALAENRAGGARGKTVVVL